MLLTNLMSGNSAFFYFILSQSLQLGRKQWQYQGKGCDVRLVTYHQ